MKNRKFIWYPFLFAAYPVLGLLAHNIGNARPEAGARPVAVRLPYALQKIHIYHNFTKTEGLLEQVSFPTVFK